MKWDWIFFDADETLFIFNSSTDLQRTPFNYSITFTAEDFQDYQAVNKPLWMNYQGGAIISLQFQHGRPESWAERLNVESGKLNEASINAMVEIYTPLLGAVSLLNAIRGNVKIGVITGGFSALQQVRLERTGLRDCFDLLVISKEIGAAKPGKKIFDCALEQVDNPDHLRVLIAGDTVESNILGGVNARLVTCWLDAHNREQPEGTAPAQTISSPHELEQFLCKHWLPLPC